MKIRIQGAKCLEATELEAGGVDQRAMNVSRVWQDEPRWWLLGGL